MPDGLNPYAIVGILLATVVGLATLIMLATHLIGPKRSGAVKDIPYEAGVDPIGDARQRFNVRFYIVAMLFLLFDVEIVFFYPWAVLFPRLHDTGTHAAWSNAVLAGGFGTPFWLTTMMVFTAILLIGYVYAWRKGVFRWD